MTHGRGRSGLVGALVDRDGRPRTPAFLVLATVGAFLLVVSWVDASGEKRYEDQLSALNLGIVGTAVVLGACALYLVLFRRGIRLRLMLDDLADLLRDLVGIARRRHRET